MLEELKGLATQLGFVVREERLLRDASYHVRSGDCRLRDRRLILLDRTASPGVQLDALVEILAQEPWDGVAVSPQAVALLARARRRGWPAPDKAA